MAIRSYALVIMDDEDVIKDRFTLDLVTEPKGNGFELELSTISGDIEDIITNVKQKKPKITMNVVQHQSAYLKSNILAQWIQRYSTTDSNMFLEYNDTNITKYCGGKVTKLSKDERSDGDILVQQLEFTMTTPFFIKRDKKITIKISAKGKSYPYTYPYSYGSQEIKDNEIDNPYLLGVPVNVTITGPIDNPRIILREVEQHYYTDNFREVSFPNVTIRNGEKLIINSANSKIIKVGIDGTKEDYRPKVDPTGDTFLIAYRGKSELSANITTAFNDGATLEGGWRQYTL